MKLRPKICSVHSVQWSEASELSLLAEDKDVHAVGEPLRLSSIPAKGRRQRALADLWKPHPRSSIMRRATARFKLMSRSVLFCGFSSASGASAAASLPGAT